MLSIAAMIGILAWNFPRRQMYLIWATLLSEFANNSRRLLKMHGRLTPRLSVWLSVAITLNVVLFRVTGALVAIVWSLQGGTNSLALVLNVGAMSIYILYMLRMSARELTRSELLAVRIGSPTKLIVAGNWEINLLGIFLGLGIVCTEVSALWIYEANVNHLTSKAEIHSIAWASLQAVIAGLFGAHATACLVRFSVVPAEAEQKSPRMCMQGGLVFAGAVILLSPTMESTVDRGTFLSCMSMSFLLLEAIGQIGYLYAGSGLESEKVGSCVTSRELTAASPTTGTSQDVSKATGSAVLLGEKLQTKTTVAAPTQLPLPLVVSLLCSIGYCVLLGANFSGYVGLSQASAIALVAQGTVRVAAYCHRKDSLSSVELPLVNRVVPWGVLSSTIQMGVAAGHLAFLECMTTPDMTNRWACLVYLRYYSSLLIGFASARYVVAFWLQPMAWGEETSDAFAGDGKEKERRGKIISTRNIAAAAGMGLCFVMAAGDYFEAMPTVLTSVDQANISAPQSAMWNAISSWQFAISILGAALFPVVAVQISH
ncbi:hypothetical protein B0T26DRAFT_721619 [Lasiosphaeria miniovina]|uniref:Uncharacterized protein n=1 Tax=Lasiosphaeria miniovina TaxID=1954250 RepID=A0AA40DMS5_9PEZI|nr:uncharacterized protein B0T26DRAFT_721619 [Lasiosphaeria miniovina]KAK0709459.1 hypothetical protein B0T26DRAFT_721619 [Lasiosphaeria miniovina]